MESGLQERVTMAKIKHKTTLKKFFEDKYTRKVF